MNLDQRLQEPALDDFSRRNDKMTKRPNNGFDDLGIAPNLLKGIDRLNFANPTPIQLESIPLGLKGNDIIGLALTGSGKTLGYGIPMLQRLSKMKRGIGLVLVPTRELAIQVEESLQSFINLANLRSVVLIGGASMFVQRNTLKKNPRIIIATPGRLMDHIERKTVSLSNTEIFILDEADRMLDMGFIPDIKKIMSSLPEKHQTMLFSATMPKEIEAIADSIMENPTRIEVDRSGATPTEISHEMFCIKNQDKSRLLAVQLKQCTGPVLVFTRTKRMASKLKATVSKMGFIAAEIHSDRSLAQRRSALEGFKKGIYNILIATDIAARGIDVTGIELVVNYDMPANSEDYVHRIGRTGRAGKTGHAVSFANANQIGSIRSIERFMKTKLSFSALPTLPSEKLLLKEARQTNYTDDSSSDDRPSFRKPAGRPSYRKPTEERISKRPDFKSEFSSDKKSSNRERFEERSSRRPDFKKRASEKFGKKPDESIPEGFKRKDSVQPESKNEAPKPKKTKPADTKKNDSQNENAFWSNFKKHRPARKKSVGQGSRRKRRAKSI
ncbi:MAG: DEAD/DEAH box helicase [bacterium]